ncbi:PTS transporter subunit EIIC [Paenibacillus tarimensis]
MLKDPYVMLKDPYVMLKDPYEIGVTLSSAQRSLCQEEFAIHTGPKEIASALLPLLGGKSNIVSATHCTTRLRLTLLDEGKADVAGLEKLDDVQGVFYRTGQLQIILGIGMVSKVHKILEELMADKSESDEETSAVTGQKRNILIEIIKTLSNVFIPIIPVIIVSALFMSLIGIAKAFHPAAEDSEWINLLNMFASSIFMIFPVIVGFSAAKEFGGTPYLGAAIGGILTHPDLFILWKIGGKAPEYIEILGVQFALDGNPGAVISVLISVYLMSKVEKKLRRGAHPFNELFVIPFVTVITTGIVTLSVIGPLGALIGVAVTNILGFVYTNGGLITGFLFGGLYPLLVITGLHHSFYVIEAGLLANPDIGVNYLLPIWSMANVAQGGAGLAVYLKTRNKKMRNIAVPAIMSSFFGIIEPVVFGMNLKLRRPFLAACIGGAVGGAYVVATHVAATAFGLTGVTMLAITVSLGVWNVIHYLVGFILAVVCAFLATRLLGFKEEKE